MRRKILLLVDEAVPKMLLENASNAINNLILEAYLLQKNATDHSSPSSRPPSFKFVRNEHALKQLNACRYPPAALLKLVATSSHKLSAQLACPDQSDIDQFMTCRVDTIGAVMLAIHIVDCEHCFNRYTDLEAVTREGYLRSDTKGFLDVINSEPLGFLGSKCNSQPPPSSAYPRPNFPR